ncbi:MAG: hypothetical protein J6J45_06415 [Clostridia bacterium]|nr:hypothetical protein [Clostridia bacterium]
MVSPPRSHRMMLGSWKAPTPNLKSNFNPAGLILLILLILIMFAVFIGVTGNKKTPATPEQIISVIKKQGYEPQDITELHYSNNAASKTSLKKCIAFFYEDIHFEYFHLSNDSTAINLYSQFHRKIVDNYNASHIIETENKQANFVIYTLDNGEKYNVSIYVGNTVVYAYCDSQNKNEINKILDAIDYLNP